MLDACSQNNIPIAFPKSNAPLNFEDLIFWIYVGVAPDAVRRATLIYHVFSIVFCSSFE